MLSNSQIVTIIQNNLNHDALYPIQLFLTKLIERQNYGNGINQYRIYDNVTNSYIVDLNDFISKLVATEIEPYIDFNFDLRNENYGQAVNIKLKNFVVELNNYSYDDNDFLMTFGNRENLSKKIIFVMGNMDSTFTSSLPLVIRSIKLI